MNKNTGKFFWGPALWKTMHSLAASYTPDQRAYMKDFIYSLIHLLPCKYCKTHWKNNLEMLNIDDYLGNNHDCFLFTYFMHDIVNKSLGKKSPPFNQIKSIYFKGMGPECSECKL